ncbi:MAG: hypothetical protein U0360_08635 [Dehalococcoidia bacterium]
MRTHLSWMNGPVPMACSLRKGSSCISSFGQMNDHDAMFVGKSTSGCVRLTTSVLGSGVSNELTSRKTSCWEPPFLYRSKDILTSSEVITRPFTGATLWNFTPGRRWKVNFVASGLTSHFEARSGSTSSRCWFARAPILARTSLFIV